MRMAPSLRPLPWVGCVLLSGLVAMPVVVAAGTPGIQEEVVVIGERRAYRGDFAPLETPRSIQVIDAELLVRAGARDLNEALDLAPSVARQNNFGGLWNSYAVRGFVGDPNLPSGYLVNGFNAGRGFGGGRDLSGIDSVEVLKGPTAALFGRGEPGGTINLVTKRPGVAPGGQLRISADRYETYRADVDWSSGLIGAAGAVRLVGFYEDGESFRDTIETKRYGASPSVFWRLGENTSVLYELEASRQEVPFDRGVVAVDGRLGVIPPNRFLGEPGDGPMKAEVLGHQFELRHTFNADWDLLVGLGLRDTSLEGFSSEPELGASRQRLFVDGRTLTRQRRQRDYDAEYRVIRGEVSGRFDTGSFEHRLLIGMDADRFENDQVFKRYRAPTLGSGPTLQQSFVIDILAPVYGQFPLPAVSPLTDRVETLEAVGVYVQDQIALTDRLQVRLGFRYDDYEQKLNNRLAASQGKESDARLSPQVGAVYALREDVALFVAYGEGFRANSGADADGRAFDPNESDSFEAGVRLELADLGVSATAALFRIDQENILTADPANPGFSAAIGRARSQGVELDVAASLAGVDLAFSYAWVDAEIRNDVLDPDFGLPINAGDRLLNVPKHSASLQAAYDFQFAGAPLTVGVGALYVGDRLGEAGTDFELPDYFLVRAFVAWSPWPRVTLRGEVDNLFDETYYTNSYSQLWIQPGMPRRWRLAMELEL